MYSLFDKNRATCVYLRKKRKESKIVHIKGRIYKSTIKKDKYVVLYLHREFSVTVYWISDVTLRSLNNSCLKPGCSVSLGVNYVLCDVTFESFSCALYCLPCFWIFNHQTAFHFVLPTDICASPITLCSSGYERLSKSPSRNFGSSAVTETAFWFT